MVSHFSTLQVLCEYLDSGRLFDVYLYFDRIFYFYTIYGKL